MESPAHHFEHLGCNHSVTGMWCSVSAHEPQQETAVSHPSECDTELLLGVMLE